MSNKRHHYHVNDNLYEEFNVLSVQTFFYKTAVTFIVQHSLAIPILAAVLTPDTKFNNVINRKRA